MLVADRYEGILAMLDTAAGLFHSYRTSAFVCLDFRHDLTAVERAPSVVMNRSASSLEIAAACMRL